MRISDWSSDVCSSDLAQHVCEALRKHGVTAPIDVHLMVEPVDRIVPDFANAGASLISFHPEASRHVYRTVQLIKSHGCQAGLVLNPGTPVEVLDYVLDELDMVLLMSVNRSEEHTSELQSLMRISYAVFCMNKQIPIPTKSFL